MGNSDINRYWANAVALIGIAFAIALAMRGCSNIMVEQEKTKRIEIKYDRGCRLVKTRCEKCI